MLELDVVISADHQVVVSHEPWLSSTICLDAGGRRIAPEQEQQHNLYQLPYANIRRCDCGSLPHPQFSAQRLVAAPKPLLREVFAAVEAAAQRLGRAPVRYAIEVKSSPADDGIYQPVPAVFVPLVVAEILAAALAARCTLLSFDARILRGVRSGWPHLATCLLTEAPEPWLSSIALLGFVPTAYGPDFSTVTPALVRQLRAAHPALALVPWTVNEPADLLRLAALGVDGITTDYPDRALSVLM